MKMSSSGQQLAPLQLGLGFLEGLGADGPLSWGVPLLLAQAQRHRLAQPSSQPIGEARTVGAAAAESGGPKEGKRKQRARKAPPAAVVTLQQVSLHQAGPRKAADSGTADALLSNIGAGAVARTLAQAFIHPLDTIKTRLQVSSRVPNLQAWQSGVAASCRRIQMLGGLCSVKLCNFGPSGLLDLYTGLAGSMLGTLPAAAAFFSAQEGCKRVLAARGQDPNTRDLVTHLVSSSVAAFSSAIIRVPADVLKHRVQAYMYRDMWQAAKATYAAGGVRGLYCGFGATLLRDVPEMAIQFSVYEALRHALTQQTQQQGRSSTTQPHPLLLGGAAGAVAAVFTTPLDVLKTQLQCQGVCNVRAALQGVLQSRGIAGLTAGMGPRVLQTTLQSAAFFALYEAFKRELALQRVRQQQEEAEGGKQRRQHQDIFSASEKLAA